MFICLGVWLLPFGRAITVRLLLPVIVSTQSVSDSTLVYVPATDLLAWLHQCLKATILSHVYESLTVSDLMHLSLRSSKFPAYS